MWFRSKKPRHQAQSFFNNQSAKQPTNKQHQPSKAHMHKVFQNKLYYPSPSESQGCAPARSPSLRPFQSQNAHQAYHSVYSRYIAQNERRPALGPHAPHHNSNTSTNNKKLPATPNSSSPPGFFHPERPDRPSLHLDVLTSYSRSELRRPSIVPESFSVRPLEQGASTQQQGRANLARQNAVAGKGKRAGSEGYKAYFPYREK
ncbi:hypothetical protein CC78DRAFT_532269 [Lojkania enalia]|uniref:Uncharacterized protein n=1 Tax=Lojkania enalia TaxID=147567 RepID=A0A9P4KAD8_9PLEO|nr:hypothetical protein CC78DRAFT_532269 [Didymosphaeria enalia]